MLKEGEVRIPAGCAISGIFSRAGKPISGGEIVSSISTMHDRSNGLGGGFAAYGIYPEYPEHFAFHLFYDSDAAKRACEAELKTFFTVADEGPIPTRKVPGVGNGPIIWRYFAAPRPEKMEALKMDEQEYTVRFVLRINRDIGGAYIFSSGKNMGVFKAVGFPEDVGEFYKLESYRGYSWTAHGRYPTNTPGWWGGAHPFALGQYTIVHNGEISSYDANRRFIEMFGYHCSLLTDTEVITYVFDYLNRVQGLSLEDIALVIAAPFWEEIDRMPEEQKRKLYYLRNMFASLLITGPFSIILGFDKGIMALNDRLKLRSMVAGEKDDRLYIASEECAIRVLAPQLDKFYAAQGGVPIIARLEEGTN